MEEIGVPVLELVLAGLAQASTVKAALGFKSDV
jgi:hypothetical protein